jgi:hypothetical protein
LISRVQVKPRTCKFGAPIQVGGKSLYSVENTSAIFKKPIDALMSSKVRTRKDKLFRFIIDTMVPTKDGRFSILTRRQRLKPRDSMKNLDSISIDHSTLDQDSQCRELLSAMEPITSGSEDGERMPWVNNGSSMRFPRQSSLNNGNITHLTSKETEDQPM